MKSSRENGHLIFLEYDVMVSYKPEIVMREASLEFP